MSKFAYLAVMALVVLGSTWLEVALRTRVFRRWLRLLLSIIPVFLVFFCWDAYAIANGHWTFHPDLTTGVTIGNVPLDEVVFFIVIPLASILTLEAVRSVKGWDAGDGA